MALWYEWLARVRELRPACARNRTFCWMALVLAGLSVRSDLAGVTSVVRALWLQARAYRRLLYLRLEGYALNQNPLVKYPRTRPLARVALP